MTDTITIATVDHTPRFIDGYSATRDSRTVEHGDVAVVLRPAAPRSGRLRTQFDDEAAAFAFVAALGDTPTGTLTSSERPSYDMAFYLPDRGAVEITLDTETRDHWWVAFDYKEIPA